MSECTRPSEAATVGDTHPINRTRPVRCTMVALAVDLGHRLTWNAVWNKYHYAESSFVGPSAPRYFHAYNTTISLHCEFLCDSPTRQEEAPI